MKNSHLSELEIQQLIELSAPEREQNNAYYHICVCKVCEKRFHDLERLHEALQKQQIGPTDEIQVERVMERIRSGARPSLIIPMFHRLAYILAMILVLTVIGVIFYQLDVFDEYLAGAPTGEMSLLIPEYIRIIQNKSIEFGGWLTGIYDRIFGFESVPVVLFAVVFLFFIAVLDRFVLSPILQRER